MEVNLPEELRTLVYASASRQRITTDEFIAEAIRRSEASRFATTMPPMNTQAMMGVNVEEKLREFAAKQVRRNIEFDDSRPRMYER